MKKKIKDLTMAEIEGFCYYYADKPHNFEKCMKCPLFNLSKNPPDCLIANIVCFVHLRDRGALDKEIEVPKTYGGDSEDK